MLSIDSRIRDITAFLRGESNQRPEGTEKIRVISSSAYKRMNIIQKLSLPFDVRPENKFDEHLALFKNVFDGKISDEVIKEALKETNGKFYDWTDRQIKAITIRTGFEKKLLSIDPEFKAYFKILYDHLLS